MLKGLAVTLVVAGLSLLAYAGFEVAARQRHQSVEGQRLEQDLKAAAVGIQTPAAGAPAARARAARHGAWGRLEIPRLGLSVVLDEGIDAATLSRAVGHVPGTAFPGERGNVVLAGHRDGLFRPLRDVRRGDRVQIATLDGTFDYEIASLEVVAPERTDVLHPGPQPEVTLVTCYPFSYVGPAPQRYIVKARALTPGTAAAGRR